jgi:DNA-binding protein HU-beta
MNKSELVGKIAEKSNLTKKDSEKALNAFVESVMEALQNSDKVQLTGFGTFAVHDRAERKGRNPQTGEEIVIPASKAPAFKAGSELKKAVSGRA